MKVFLICISNIQKPCRIYLLVKLLYFPKSNEKYISCINCHCMFYIVRVVLYESNDQILNDSIEIGFAPFFSFLG